MQEVVNAELWSRQLQQWKDEGEQVTKSWSELVAKAHNNGHWGDLVEGV